MKKLVLSLLLFICVINSVFAEAVEVIPTQNKTLNINNGRFVFGQISNARKDQYMLDTKTGRLWGIVISKEGETVLQIVPYSNFNNNGYSIMPQ